MKPVIKQKEFNDLLKAMSNLYGVLISDDIYVILNTYYNHVTKAEILEQLKKLSYKPKRDYFAAKITGMRNKYLLIKRALEDEVIDFIVQNSQNKPLFIPSTKEELLEYKVELYMNEEEDVYYTKLMRFLVKRYNKKEDAHYHAFAFTMGIFILNKEEMEANENPIEKIQQFGFSIDTKKQLNEFLKLWYDAHNNTKMFCNKGYSPKELSKLEPSKDIENLVGTLGENIKEMIRNNELDGEELIKQLREADSIPLKFKNGLISEIQALINEKKNNKA